MSCRKDNGPRPATRVNSLLITISKVKGTSRAQNAVFIRLIYQIRRLVTSQKGETVKLERRGGDIYTNLIRWNRRGKFAKDRK